MLLFSAHLRLSKSKVTMMDSVPFLVLSLLEETIPTMVDVKAHHASINRIQTRLMMLLEKLLSKLPKNLRSKAKREKTKRRLKMDSERLKIKRRKPRLRKLLLKRPKISKKPLRKPSTDKLKLRQGKNKIEL